MDSKLRYRSPLLDERSIAALVVVTVLLVVVVLFGVLYSTFWSYEKYQTKCLTLCSPCYFELEECEDKSASDLRLLSGSYTTSDEPRVREWRKGVKVKSFTS